MKILILAANPRKDLNLDREIRDLKAVIEKSRSREQFEVVTELAVRVEDLQELMLKHEPQILHFCGHGGGEEGLVFASDEVKEQWLKADALSNLFRLFTRHLECVLMNACYSEVQANAMIEHINYVIGMRQTIQDNAAIAFSKGFYRALGYDRPIVEAYEFGCNAIQLEITGSSKIRSAATEADRKAEVVDAIQQTTIPEYLKPILKIKSTLIAKSAPAPILTSEARTEINLEISQSLTENSGSDHYRTKVREFLADHILSKFEEIRLEQLREKLELTPGEANQILAEEWQPIREAQAEYRDMLTRLIREGYFPFDTDTENELQQLRQELELTDREIADISQPIFDEYHAQKAQQAQQEYENKLQRYRQEFLRAIEAGYPIEEAIRSGLKIYQQLLGLSNEEVTRIEQPLIASKEAEYKRKHEEQQQRQLEEQRRKELERQIELEKQRNIEQQAQKEYEDKLQRYGLEFIRAIAEGYPIEETVRTGLKSFQQSLGLTNEDIARIEQPLLARKEVEYKPKQKEQQQLHLEEQQRKTEAKPKAQELAKPGENPEAKSSSSSPRLEQFSFDVITVDSKGNENSHTKKSATFFSVDLGNGILLEMVKIPAGNFLMGSPDREGYNNERPQHLVNVAPFYMGRLPVTQAQWRAVAGYPQAGQVLNPDPSYFKGDHLPVEQVSWDDATEFCARLSRKTSQNYRLPSEAEWEYACRAGTKTKYYFGDDESSLGKYAWFGGNSGDKPLDTLKLWNNFQLDPTKFLEKLQANNNQTQLVGSFPANAFGLHDMHGRVWEWCLDHWHDNYDAAPEDGSAWLSLENENKRVLRGGSWFDSSGYCRSANRVRSDPDYRNYITGFRLVCVAPCTS
jgi:formylglycine-generating enzyme required for sulfatase activity